MVNYSNIILNKSFTLCINLYMCVCVYICINKLRWDLPGVQKYFT